MRKLIIDASNLRAGGGIIHLQKIFQVGDPQAHGFQKVIVYGGQNPLEHFPKKSWLDLREIRKLNRSFLHRLQWQHSQLGRLAEQEQALLFMPGGLYLGKYRPYVTMFQNMQIFETPEKNREGLTKEWLRLSLLHLGQAKTFRHCSGLICLSEYSQSYLQQFYPHLLKNVEVRRISHGISQFDENSKDYELKNPVQLLYVSTVKQYKHQWHLIDAVAQLKREGYSLELHLIGSGDQPALKQMKEAIKRHSDLGEFAHYHGGLSHHETMKWYGEADLFVFPSSCETFGISLLEAMASALPIACSDRGPMLEVLRDAGFYFNPEQPKSIAASLKMLLDDKTLRQRLGRKALEYSQKYTWERCAQETFSFLQSVNQRHCS